MVLLYALHEQWSIENDFNIFRELLCVTFIWNICNQFLAFVWIIHPQLNFDSGDNYLTLEQTKLLLITSIQLRSLGCILTSTVKTIYDTYKSDQLVPIPPNEKDIDCFEQVLRNKLAFDYFFIYLKFNNEFN